MKRVLILGANGMLGRTLVLNFHGVPKISLGFTNRPGSFDRRLSPLLADSACFDLDAALPERYIEVFNNFRPDYIVNCVGIVKQRSEANDPLISLRVNSVFPHWLSWAARRYSSRLIHISTDCVFSGRHGSYAEDQQTDAVDLYGKTKAMGELASHPFELTLRTSIIGHEVNHKFGLLEWFLAQKGSVDGYLDAFFSGLTTTRLSKLILSEILREEKLSGLFHVGGPRVSKFELLRQISEVYGCSTVVKPVGGHAIDRSLNSTRWYAQTGDSQVDWNIMLLELREWWAKNRNFF